MYDVPAQDGMTLRDYFAAKALPAIINEPSMASDFGRDFIARQAYLMADAMLKAREQCQPHG